MKHSPSSPAAEGAAVHLRSYAPYTEIHAHDFHQLVLPVSGCLELEIGGQAGQVKGRTGALVPSGERHAFAASSRNAFLVLDLPIAAVELAEARAWIDRAGRARFFPIANSASQLAAWFTGEVPLDSAAPAPIASAFATLLLRAASGPSRPPDRLLDEPAAVRRALTFIDRSALGPVTVSGVARAAGVSARHLQVLFRAHVGRTPLEVIRARRIEEARQLLATTDLAIAEVALRCGFSDQASLTHAMRRVLLTTPGRIRRHRP